MTSLWKGPEVDGITPSLLAKFIVCRERFRLKVVEGYREAETEFDHKIEYGSMWHAMEEARSARLPYAKALEDYCEQLRANYPSARDQIDKWSAICLRQFRVCQSLPMKIAGRVRIAEEAAFRVPYILPSGRKVLLRGKIDGVIKTKAGIYNEEDKTKGFVDQEGIGATIQGNLQSMIYQQALRQGLTTRDDGTPIIRYITKGDARKEECLVCGKPGDKLKVAGTYYRVARRPLAERSPMRQRKSESPTQFYNRIEQAMKEDPSYYFKTFTIPITQKMHNWFLDSILNPWLETLCNWWEWIRVDPHNPTRPRTASEIFAAAYPGHQGKKDLSSGRRLLGQFLDEPIPNDVHFQTPWGVFNSMFGGFRGDFFELLAKGRTWGLTKTNNLFPELPSLLEKPDAAESKVRKPRPKASRQ